jgi:hypothetical protein
MSGHGHRSQRGLLRAAEPLLADTAAGYGGVPVVVPRGSPRRSSRPISPFSTLGHSAARNQIERGVSNLAVGAELLRTPAPSNLAPRRSTAKRERSLRASIRNATRCTATSRRRGRASAAWPRRYTQFAARTLPATSSRSESRGDRAANPPLVRSSAPAHESASSRRSAYERTSTLDWRCMRSPLPSKALTTCIASVRRGCAAA